MSKNATFLKPVRNFERYEYLFKVFQEYFINCILLSKKPTPTSPPVTTKEDDYYYDEGENEESTYPTYNPPLENNKKPYIEKNYAPVKTTSTTSSPNVEITRGYENFIKSFSPIQKAPTSSNVTSQNDEYYDYETNDDQTNLKNHMLSTNISKMVPASETFAPKLKFALNTKTTTPTSVFFNNNSNRNQKLKQSSHSPSNAKAAGSSSSRLSNKPTFRPNNARNRIKITSKFLTTEKPNYETTTSATTTQIQTTSVVERAKNPSTSTQLQNYTIHTETIYGQKNQSHWKLTNTNKRPDTYKKNIWEIDEYLPNR